MENKSTEKIIEKIKKILELSRNNPSAEEAASAALKAQKIMAEYHIDIAEIEAVEDVKNISEKQVNVGKGNKWKYLRAGIIAKNFRCKHFYYGKSVVVFYGYKEDAVIAAMTFEFLYENGNRAANNYYQKRRKEALQDNYYFNGKGIKNAFLVGYLQGIKESLEKQCTALMLVIPKQVEERYKDISSGFKKMQNNGLTIRGSSEGEKAEEYGTRVGKEIIASKCIEAAI